MPNVVARAVTAGFITPEAGRRWLEGYEELARGADFFCTIMYAVAGRKPA